MDLASFIVGMVVAWIIALLVYWFGAQRETAEKIANTVPLNQYLTELQDAEARIAQLHADLQAAQAAAQAAEQAAMQEAEQEAQQQLEEEQTVEQEPSQPAASQATERSDLKRVEGIGPKIEGLLNDAGIYRFRQLAEADVEDLKVILEQAGERYQLADPGTWPQQARLAAEGKWDELTALQDELKGGR
jgi:predicted flap endonuclease-1-like 5' DNA nuclease